MLTESQELSCILLIARLTVIPMSRPATGRTTKLVRVPIRFEAQVKAYIRKLKEKEARVQQGQK